MADNGTFIIHRALDTISAMSEHKCPFSIVQASATCHCRNAREVIRRGGSEFDCTAPDAHGACVVLVEHFNAVALPALGYADDLTLTPKSVYERILVGGLQGLRMTQDPANNGLETADIWGVVEAARTRYPSLDAIPGGDFVPAIEACKLRKRRRKQ